MHQKLNIEELITLGKQAGKAILEVYNRFDADTMIEQKSDNSPLTLADKASHEVIDAGLKKLYPQIPVISEEGKDIPYAERSAWHTLWLVDPLDGTKEFIKRNGEFTVNIALIENGKTVWGLIYAPVPDILYFTDNNKSYIEEKGIRRLLQVNKTTTNLTAVGSRSHANAEDATFLARYDIKENVSIGSSLKFCLVAEGKADLYFRSGPTMEWDTAAGQAIIEQAGGKMTNTAGEPFIYNKTSLLNSGFLVTGW